MIKAYSYIRFSTPEQRLGDSLRRQLEAAEAYAAKHGLELDTSLRDEGVSALKGDHRRKGALGGFIAEVHNSNIAPGSLLIVENLDRLSREPIDSALDQFMSLLRAGIEIVTLSDGRHYDRSSLGNLTDLIISLSTMSRAHDESARKSERNSAAWSNKRKQAAESGKPMTALCPWWMRLRDDRAGFDLIPEYAEIARTMFDDTIRGIGRRAMVKKLNSIGVELPRRGRRQAHRWHVSLVSKTINNRAAIGEFISTRGDVIPGYYPPLVDESVFYQAQAAAVSRRKSGGPKGRNFGNLMTGMCRCIECGGTVRFQHRPQDKGGKYLYCDNHKNERCTNRRRWRYDHIEATALLLLADAVDWTAVYGNGDNKKQAIENAVTVERSKLERAELAQDTFKALMFDPSDAVAAQATQDWKQATEDVSLLRNAITKLEAELSAYTPAQRSIDSLEKAFGKLGVDGTYEDRAHVNALLKSAGLELWFGDAGVVWRIGKQKGVLIDGARADEVGDAVMLAAASAKANYAVDEMMRTVAEADAERSKNH